MIIVTAKAAVRSESVPGFEALLKPLIDASRSAEGCISYEVYKNVESGTNWFFFEKWATQLDFEEQMQTKPVLDFLASVQPMLSAPAEMKQYTVAGIGPK